jgi:hypothetical protein
MVRMVEFAVGHLEFSPLLIAGRSRRQRSKGGKRNRLAITIGIRCTLIRLKLAL